MGQSPANFRSSLLKRSGCELWELRQDHQENNNLLQGKLSIKIVYGIERILYGNYEQGHLIAFQQYLLVLFIVNISTEKSRFNQFSKTDLAGAGQIKGYGGGGGDIFQKVRASIEFNMVFHLMELRLSNSTIR